MRKPNKYGPSRLHPKKLAAALADNVEVFLRGSRGRPIKIGKAPEVGAFLDYDY